MDTQNIIKDDDVMKLYLLSEGLVNKEYILKEWKNNEITVLVQQNI